MSATELTEVPSEAKTATYRAAVVRDFAEPLVVPTCAHDFLYGTDVTLTAVPAAGSRFAGWINGCSGTSSHRGRRGEPGLPSAAASISTTKAVGTLANSLANGWRNSCKQLFPHGLENRFGLLANNLVKLITF
jgi:hypothetical protein